MNEEERERSTVECLFDQSTGVEENARPVDFERNVTEEDFRRQRLGLFFLLEHSISQLFDEKISNGLSNSPRESI